MPYHYKTEKIEFSQRVLSQRVFWIRASRKRRCFSYM